MVNDTESTVRKYFETVADLRSTEADLRTLLDPEVQITEHPNAITPAGATRGLDETLAGFASGKALLAQQTFDIHEVVVEGDRAAVRAIWTGVIGIDAGRLANGTTLVAHIAAFVTVRNGKIIEHETFDCYEPQ